MLPGTYFVLWIMAVIVVFAGACYGAFACFLSALLGVAGVLYFAARLPYGVSVAWPAALAYLAIAGIFFLKAARDKRIESHLGMGDFDTGKEAFYFLDRIEKEIGKIKKYGGLLTIAKLDMDHFRKINEKLGHFQGDMMLRLFGRALVYNTRPKDIAVRYAADEFLIVFPETSALKAHEIIDNVRAKLEEHRAIFPVKGIKNPFSFSVGIVEFSNDYENVREFFRAVDEALFDAKKKGPSATVVLDKDKRRTFRNRRYWERIDISDIENVELFVYDRDGIRHKVELGNISVGGTMFMSPKDLNYGDIIDMELVLENGERIIIEGKQIWKKQDAMSEQIGVFLMHLSPQQKFVLHRNLYGKHGKKQGK